MLSGERQRFFLQRLPMDWASFLLTFCAYMDIFHDIRAYIYIYNQDVSKKAVLCIGSHYIGQVDTFFHNSYAMTYAVYILKMTVDSKFQNSTFFQTQETKFELGQHPIFKLIDRTMQQRPRNLDVNRKFENSCNSACDNSFHAQ